MDRNKFKGGTIRSIKETRKEAEAKSGYGERSTFHTVEEGVNIFRIMPPHPGNERPYVPFRRSFLECKSEKWENGEPTGEFELKNKSIFISTVHGGTEEDIIEIYCSLATQSVKDKLVELKSKGVKSEELKKKEAELYFPLRGGRIGKKYQNGILPSTSYMCYTLKDGKLGRLELYSTWMKKVEELNIDEDTNEEAAVDRFSDPETGVHLLINKKKKEKGEGWDYVLSKREFSPTKYKTWDEFIKNERVTDQQLEELLKLKSLEELYGSNVYKRSDFLLAIDGLQRFDEKHNYGIFQKEEFISKIKEFENLFPEEETDLSDPEGTLPIVDDEALSPGGEDFSSWSVPKLREYIQKYLDNNYPGVSLGAVPKPKLIEWAVIVEKKEDLPIDQISGGDSVVKTDSIKSEIIEKKDNENTISESTQKRIENLKNLGKKK